jgi:integrase/recombinase XerD
LFRPLRHNGKRQDERRHMNRNAIDRVVRAGAAALGLVCGYSAHSVRATFITTALENGAALEDVQKTAGHNAIRFSYRPIRKQYFHKAAFQLSIFPNAP